MDKCIEQTNGRNERGPNYFCFMEADWSVVLVQMTLGYVHDIFVNFNVNLKYCDLFSSVVVRSAACVSASWVVR